MSQSEKVFEPSHFEPGDAHGLLRGFEPGTRTVAARCRIDHRFRSLPSDIVWDKDIAVTLRDGVHTAR
ncbi:MAG: hypothetical protein WA317_12030 [Mycobacterium sp.]|uniref:hypothetical protein n=1 Tax=Mycobacterium sp. TaxID=1785 RepID=UPI003CC6C698